MSKRLFIRILVFILIFCLISAPYSVCAEGGDDEPVDDVHGGKLPYIEYLYQYLPIPEFHWINFCDPNDDVRWFLEYYDGRWYINENIRHGTTAEYIDRDEQHHDVDYYLDHDNNPHTRDVHDKTVEDGSGRRIRIVRDRMITNVEEIGGAGMLREVSMTITTQIRHYQLYHAMVDSVDTWFPNSTNDPIYQFTEVHNYNITDIRNDDVPESLCEQPHQYVLVNNKIKSVGKNGKPMELTRRETAVICGGLMLPTGGAIVYGALNSLDAAGFTSAELAKMGIASFGAFAGGGGGGAGGAAIGGEVAAGGGAAAAGETAMLVGGTVFAVAFLIVGVLIFESESDKREAEIAYSREILKNAETLTIVCTDHQHVSVRLFDRPKDSEFWKFDKRVTEPMTTENGILTIDMSGVPEGVNGIGINAIFSNGAVEPSVYDIMVNLPVVMDEGGKHVLVITSADWDGDWILNNVIIKEKLQKFFSE